MYQEEEHPQLIFRIDERPIYTNDLEDIDLFSTELFIDGKTKSIEKLKSYSKLQKLWLYNINQEKFNSILNLVNPKMLHLLNMRVEDLTMLGSLSKLEVLALEWNTKSKNLWDMTNNRSLKSLSIKDFSKLNDISLIQTCPNLEILDLSGGEWNKLKLNTLDSLKNLQHLKFLGLIWLRVEDESLKPISHLKSLEKLRIATNEFPTEEYARLSVTLLNTKCECFQPYLYVSPPIDGRDVLIVGKRKPFLNSNIDSKKLLKYEEQFKSFQEKYTELHIKG